ncbi:MAG: hypothetical protein DMG92_12140 [Acidobacteria bacterium]|nr:MAG: hypothetical protein DMG92_12140 [Acidobacteriota bacterium]
MTYDFYLKDSATSGPGTWGEGDRYVVGTELKLLFDEVCQLSSCPFDISDFWWDPTSVSTTSLLIYFVDDQSSSLVRQIKPNSPLGGGGTTHISSAGNLSEVYVSAAASDENSPRALAVLAFHEAMHNLLKKGQSLHASGGMGLAAETVFSNSRLTQKNKELMAAVTGKTIPQNTSFL